jgi:ribosomal peptide maturation radical SAM protein 1
MSNNPKPLERIALVSTPWPIYSRPSIQLATLKSYLQIRHTDLRVVAYHIYLKLAEAVGYRVYHEISERTWLAESVYAALLYPDNTTAIEKLFYRSIKGRSNLRKVAFRRLTEQVAVVSDDFIDDVDWRSFGLVGFSICHCQFSSTLYFIDRIKKQHPDLPVVVGGSMFAGEAIRELLRVFPQIDFAVNGEGEQALSRLADCLKQASNHAEILRIPGLAAKPPDYQRGAITRSQLKDLTELPPPDYDEYFTLLQSMAPQKAFFPTLPAEISRGCWWKKSPVGKRYTGCTFCNLNLQWDGYRTKAPRQVVREIDLLTDKYQTLSVAFMDNLIPLKVSETVFSGLAESQKDYRLFCEIRATTPKRMLKRMKEAGVYELQIGIEALSTRLLKKLNKGTTTIQNLEIMKTCEELGLVNASNLILEFPGSDREDVEETLHNLEFAMPFRPMRSVQFWLGLGSPVWANPKDFGLNSVFNHPNWTVLFPAKIYEAMPFTIQSYRGDRMRQKKLWRPVKEKVKAWKKAYAELHREPGSKPILSYRDGKEFLIINQKRPGIDPMNHRLVGSSRNIYLFCRQPRSLKVILEHFPSFGEDRITAFLKMMIGKRLMFEEKNTYLSLAVSIQQV